MTYHAIVLGHDDQILHQMQTSERRTIILAARQSRVTWKVDDEPPSLSEIMLEYDEYHLDQLDSALYTMAHGVPILVYR